MATQASLVTPLRKSVSEAGCDRVADLENGILLVAADMQTRGLRVDPIAWSRVVEGYHRGAEEHATKLRSALTVKNLDSEAEVLEGLRRIGIHVAKTGRAALAEYRSNPTAMSLSAWRRDVAFVRGIGTAVAEHLKPRPAECIGAQQLGGGFRCVPCAARTSGY